VIHTYTSYQAECRMCRLRIDLATPQYPDDWMFAQLSKHENDDSDGHAICPKCVLTTFQPLFDKLK
jgi:hypothetical protein